MSFGTRIDLPANVQEEGVRFGRTLLNARHDTWMTHQLDAMVLPGNQRGLAGVNLAGGGRIDGGLAVERELMSRAPLTLGTAATTGAGSLADAQVNSIVHAIVSEKLGDPPREGPMRQAVTATMRELDQIRARRVGIIPFGSGNMVARVSRPLSVPVMIEEMIGHLRRASSRVESVTFFCNSRDEANEVIGLLERIRQELWGSRA